MALAKLQIYVFNASIYGNMTHAGLGAVLLTDKCHVCVSQQFVDFIIISGHLCVCVCASNN